MPDEITVENAPVETPDTEKVKKAPVSKQFTVPMPLVPQVEKMINEFRAEQKAKVDAVRNAKLVKAARTRRDEAQAAFDELQKALPVDGDLTPFEAGENVTTPLAS